MKRALSLYLPMWSIDRVRRRWRIGREKTGNEGQGPGAKGQGKGSRTQDAGLRTQDLLPSILLITTSADRQLIVQCCEQSRAAGVRPGMTLAHARALLPEKGQGPRAKGQGNANPQSTIRHPQSLPFAPHADLAALHRLAQWCTRFCPTVAPDPELADIVHASNFDLFASRFPLHTGLLMDITGCDRLYRGEVNLARALADAMHHLGFTCRLAIAPTFGAAWALARFGEHHPDRVVLLAHEHPTRPRYPTRTPGSIASVSAHVRSQHHPVGMVLPDSSLLPALRELPVRALRIDSKIEAALAEVAVDRVGHLLDLPRSQLPSRFGDSLLLRLDQALGQAMETIDPVRPEPPPCVEMDFTGPTTQYEAIELASRQLVEQLIAELQSREAGVRELVLELTRVELEPTRVRVTFTHPTRDVKHLWSLLRPQLERAHLGHGVDRLSLTARRWGRLRHEQKTMKGNRGQETGDRRQEQAADNKTEPSKPMHSRAWVPLRLASDKPPTPDSRLATPDFTPDFTLSELAAHRGQLLDVLLNRLGNERVLRMHPVATHVPSKAFRLQPAGEAMADQDGAGGQQVRRRKARRAEIAGRSRNDRCYAASGGNPPSAIHDPQSLPFPLPDRPSLLFDHPEPVRVMAVTPDGPPIQLHWRGRDLRITFSAGPLRLGGEWWREGTKERRDEGTKGENNPQSSPPLRPCVPASLRSFSLDFFRLACDDGHWLWVSRQWPQQTWQVWGMWV